MKSNNAPKPYPTTNGRQGKRLGKGFSRDELRKAGTSLSEAHRLGIPIDHLRRTGHDENVEALKSILAKKKPRVKPKKEALKT